MCESALVPADDALLAPAWVPWADRIRPGDVEPTMMLPHIKNDPRLAPGYEITEDEEADQVALWELGLGRERVLGTTGRDEAAERWYRGSHGPTAASALAADAPCSTCGFFLPVAGSMKMLFGVCANEWSPSDGKVVSADHGCGAHSQTDVDTRGNRWSDDDPVVDTGAAEPIDLDEVETVANVPASPEQVGTEQADPHKQTGAEPADQEAEAPAERGAE